MGSAILYGYMRSANGDMNAALKSYGGSQAYAQKVSLRVEDFAAVAPSQDAAQQSDAQAGMCAARPTSDRCAAPGNWANAFTVPAVNAAGLNGTATSATGFPATSH